MALLGSRQAKLCKFSLPEIHTINAITQFTVSFPSLTSRVRSSSPAHRSKGLETKPNISFPNRLHSFDNPDFLDKAVGTAESDTRACSSVHRRGGGVAIAEPSRPEP